MNHLPTGDDRIVLEEDADATTGNLLAVVAASEPRLVRTLGLLRSELTDSQLPDDIRRQLAEHIRMLANETERDAGVVVIEDGGVL